MPVFFGLQQAGNSAAFLTAKSQSKGLANKQVRADNKFAFIRAVIFNHSLCLKVLVAINSILALALCG
jgi:hypothetical protein